MTESDINLGDIEKKILETSPIANNRRNLSVEKPKTSSKKENFKKTFYNFNNIYKVNDFKFLTQKNFNQPQNLNLDERKQNMLVNAFRNNVATFLILKKYKGSHQFLSKMEKSQKNQGKRKIRGFEKTSTEDLFNNSDIFSELNKKEYNEDLKKIVITAKIAICDGENLLKSIKHQFSPESLQTEFMNKFSQHLDLQKIEDSDEIPLHLTNIYDQFLKDLTKNPLKVQVSNNEKVDFKGFLEISEESIRKYEESAIKLQLKTPIHEIIKEIIENEVGRRNDFFVDESILKSEKKNSINQNEKQEITEFQEENEKKTNSNIEENKENKNDEQEKKPNFMEYMLGLRDSDEMDKKYFEEDIIDKLLNAKDLFEVNLDFMRPNVIYPEMPELNFKNDDEKKIFTEIHKWLYEMETELEEENRVIMEYKRTKQWDDAMEIFEKDFPDADESDEEEEEGREGEGDLNKQTQ